MAPSCFEDICSHQSLLCQLWHVAVNWSARRSAELENIGRNVVVASRSGPVETGPTVLVATALRGPIVTYLAFKKHTMTDSAGRSFQSFGEGTCTAKRLSFITST